MSHKKVIGIMCVALLFMVMLGIIVRGDVKGADRMDATMLAMEGGKLSSEEAKKLEDKLKANPNDLLSRTKLLGYYSRKRFQSDFARQARQRHIMWIIQNRPDAKIAGRPDTSLNPVLDGEMYYEAKKLWLKQVETHKENTAILGNAAHFFIIHDRDVAENLLKKAQALEPDNPEWSKRLGHLYSLGLSRKSGEAKREAATKSLNQLEKTLSNTTEEINRFYMLDKLAKAAFESGDVKKARAYATELLNKAAQYRNKWNYGNAIHHGNLILGRLALKSGDLEKAKEYLIKAGKTPGSPQLNSFGPNMTLAKELLEKGEKEVVIKYFQLCANFWKRKRHRERLKNWTSIVKKDGIPDFGANLDY
ncbi:hypothetical protein ES703_81343 [subsurface metagenome]